MCARLWRARIDFGSQFNFLVHFLPSITKIGAAFVVRTCASGIQEGYDPRTRWRQFNYEEHPTSASPVHLVKHSVRCIAQPNRILAHDQP
jgi:hypothetical protein